jgi:hypothetical protein
MHRNEIFVGLARSSPISRDARFLIRRKWLDRRMAQADVPGQGGADPSTPVLDGWGWTLSTLTVDGSDVEPSLYAWPQSRSVEAR